MSTQEFDDFDTLGNRGAEVFQTHREVALVNIVWTNTHFHELLHQFLHHVGAVVHAAEQHGLVAQRNTGVSQSGTSGSRFFSHLVGVVEVGIYPDGMVFLQHIYQIVGDTLRANHGGTGSQTDNFNMRDGAQTLDDGFQHAVTHHQGIAAGEQHVAHLRGAGDIIDGFLDSFGGRFAVVLAGESTTGAVAAVHGAHVGNQEQHSVGVTVGEARNGRVLILVQRVEQVGG